jgi:hypothetical protein
MCYNRKIVVHRPKIVKKVSKKWSKSCQKVVKKLSKSCQKVAKSCQKVDKKLTKSWQKVDKKLSKKLSKSSKFNKQGWGGGEIVVPRPLASASLTGRRQKDWNAISVIKPRYLPSTYLWLLFHSYIQMTSPLDFGGKKRWLTWRWWWNLGFPWPDAPNFQFFTKFENSQMRITSSW